MRYLVEEIRLKVFGNQQIIKALIDAYIIIASFTSNLNTLQ